MHINIDSTIFGVISSAAVNGVIVELRVKLVGQGCWQASLISDGVVVTHENNWSLPLTAMASSIDDALRNLARVIVTVSSV